MARGRSERVAFVPTAEDRARYVGWWLERFELDELLEIAQMIWQPADLLADAASFEAEIRLERAESRSNGLEPMFA